MISIPPYRRRRRLAGAARGYIAAGWPVAPGAWWDPGECRYRCSQPGCLTEGLHPTLPGAPALNRRCEVTVTEAATADLGAVASRWGRQPHSVLLPTGHVSDVIEIEASAARRVQSLLAANGGLGPVARLPDDSVLLFTTVADALDPDLEVELAAAGALHHGRGSWVPLPPSQLADGPVRWTPSPGPVRWRLPSLQAVVETLRVALCSSRAERRYPGQFPAPG
jgi:hypothetical protein